MRHRFLWLKIAAICTLILSSCNPSPKTEDPAEHLQKVISALHDPSSKYVAVVSHRGDWRNYPENSISAIESVIRMGVDVMELDLKMTSDSVLVLMHDWTLDRTSTGHGPVSDYTFEELQKFDLKRGHGISIPGMKIPSLREALEVCKGKIVVNVDQGFDYYEKVIAITEELGMTEQILIKSGYPYSRIKEVFALHPRNMMYMPVCSVSERDNKATFESYISDPDTPMAFELCFGTLDDSVRSCCGRVLDAGSKVWVNTIWGSLCGEHDDDKAFECENPDDIYGPIMDLGTSIIQTDRPEFLISYLESKGRRRL